MKIEDSFTIHAPRADVVEFLLDVERMSNCVPGVSDLHRTEDGGYAAILRVRVGPIQAQFEGTVSIDEAAVPDRIGARAEGRDSSTGSVAQVDFQAHLVELPDGTTRVASESEVTLRGRLGQFGTGVMQATAATMIREFAECAGRAIETAPEDGPHVAEAASLGRVLRRGFVAYLKGIVDRLRSRLGRSGRSGSRDSGGES